MSFREWIISHTGGQTKIAHGVMVLILCIPSEVASYLFKEYEIFLDSSKF